MRMFGGCCRMGGVQSDYFRRMTLGEGWLVSTGGGSDH